MKIHFITDLEGAAMVVRFEQTRVSELTPLKLEAMRILTGEVNACIDGSLDDRTAVIRTDDPRAVLR